MPDFRRGAEAVADAQKKAQSSGSFRAFTPTLFWTDPDKNSENAEKYLLFLNPLEDIPVVEMIGFIPQTAKKGNGDKFTYYESVIARTDPAIGESEDPMVKEHDAQPRDTNVAVAVELVPVLEERNGRKRAVGFEVATTEFERRIRDEDGELTDDTEEVEAPVVGFVQQSPHNFFNLVSSFDADTAPIESTALKIKRIDSKTYTVEGFLDIPVDLSGLVDFIENLSYLGEDVDDLLDKIDTVSSDEDAALVIGEFLLDKRLEELVDDERYDTLLDSLPADLSLNPFGGKGKKGGKGKERGARKERPQRRSSRRSRNEEAEDDAPEPAQEEEQEEKPARRRRSRAKQEEAAPEPDSVTPEDNAQEPEVDAEPEEAEEKPARSRSRSSASKNKLDELREKQKNRRAK